MKLPPIMSCVSDWPIADHRVRNKTVNFLL